MFDNLPYLASFDDSFSISDSVTNIENVGTKNSLKAELKALRKRFADLQRLLYAHDRFSLLLIFQAMDAAGKDSTIRHVTRSVNPAGFQVYSFKSPSKEELDHDFLWRSASRLPERGRIGVFNRSYYEETLVVRVHPEYLHNQKLPLEKLNPDTLESLWQQRFQSIREHERHLFHNGTVILKFWLNVSPEEQKKRFISRLENPDKNWKFNAGDIEERQYWKQYMSAYEETIRATSRSYAPWFVIPADNKRYMRVCVANTIVNVLERMPMYYPKAHEDPQFYQEMMDLMQNEQLEL